MIRYNPIRGDRYRDRKIDGQACMHIYDDTGDQSVDYLIQCIDSNSSRQESRKLMD